MKLILLLASLSVLSGIPVALAQKPKVDNLPYFDKRRLHFGFTTGYNNTGFSLTRKPFEPGDTLIMLESEAGKGFNFAIVSELTLHPYFRIRFIPGFSFTERKLHYTFNQGDTAIKVISRTIESNFLDFPLYLKYRSARVNNFAAYIIAGGKFVVDVASQAKVKAGNDAIKLRRYDQHVCIGFGLDMFLEYFKFSPELKMSFGLPDLLIRDYPTYTDPVQGLRSRIFLFSLFFEG